MSGSESRMAHQAFNLLAGAATVHDGMFLLLKRSDRESFLPNMWGIPAGQVQFGEDVADASLRELAEETGLKGDISGLIGYSSFPSRRNSTQLANIQLNFLVVTQGCSVRLDPASHSDHCWISLDDLGNELLDDFTRSILSSARQCYKEYPGIL